jgi:hypothetical protein
MLLTGALTVWFNLQHAGGPGRGLAATLPSVLLMLPFDRRADRQVHHARPRQVAVTERYVK